MQEALPGEEGCQLIPLIHPAQRGPDAPALLAQMEPGAAAGQLLYEVKPLPAGFQLAGWSPDGEKLFFFITPPADASINAAQIAADCWSIHSVDTKGSDRIYRLACAAPQFGEVVWSRDGWLVYPAKGAGDGHTAAIYAFRPAGSQDLRPLATVRLLAGSTLDFHPQLNVAALPTPAPTATIPLTDLPLKQTGPGALVPLDAASCRAAQDKLEGALGLPADLSMDAPLPAEEVTTDGPTESSRGCARAIEPFR